jgi:phosphate-selective porin OprO/OprP
MRRAYRARHRETTFARRSVDEIHDRVNLHRSVTDPPCERNASTLASASKEGGSHLRSAIHLTAALLIGALLIGGMAVPALGADDEPRFGEEILEILKEEGTIDEQRYQELKAKEEAEAAERDLPPVSAGDDWTIKYSNGLQINRNDGQAKLKIGGRIQADFATIHEDGDLSSAIGGEGEGVEFRRARLFMSGEVYERIVYKAQIDFAGGDVSLKDLYLGMKGLGPLGTVKVGHMKEPYSIEELTSSKYITFMERSLPSVFDSVRNLGLSFQDSVHDDHMTWALGIFAPTDDGGEFFSDENSFNVAGRLTGTPVYADEGRSIVHVGASGAWQARDGAELRIRQRPEVHLAERYLDTGDSADSGLASNGNGLLGVELATVFGPFHATGEWKQFWLDRDAGRDATGFGGYVAAGYFLTGESRPYKRSDGTWARVKPNSTFDPGQGDWGAFEVAARYSFLDLNDEDLDGGREQNVTLGLNWYLYSNVRLTANYVFADVKDTGVGTGPAFPGGGVDGHVHTFQTRAQIEF